MDSILEKTRCYLSGPMDFIGSRVIEKYLGWRAILTPILKAFSIRVLDPWNKPLIRGHADYGKEGVVPNKTRSCQAARASRCPTIIQEICIGRDSRPRKTTTTSSWT